MVKNYLAISFDTLGVWTRLELSNLGLPSWRLPMAGSRRGGECFCVWVARPSGWMQDGMGKAKGCKILR